MKKIAIPKKEVLHYMRYNTPSIKPSISKLVDDVITEIEKINYNYKYIYLPIENNEEGVLIDNQYKLTSKDLSNFLKDCNKAVIIAVTLSTEFERQLKKYQLTDSLKALVYDACGSAYVEEICDQFSLQFEQETSFHTTSRYSPGYGDLELENQEVFYQLLELQKMGVELTENYLMIPRKTVTAIIGLSTKKQQKRAIICDCDECIIPCRKLHGG